MGAGAVAVIVGVILLSMRRNRTVIEDDRV